MNLFKGAGAHSHHAHKCFSCGMVWDHDPRSIMTDRAQIEAHTCPSCGERQFYCYQGNDGSKCCHNGVITEFYGPMLKRGRL